MSTDIENSQDPQVNNTGQEQTGLIAKNPVISTDKGTELENEYIELKRKSAKENRAILFSRLPDLCKTDLKTISEKYSKDLDLVISSFECNFTSRRVSEIVDFDERCRYATQCTNDDFEQTGKGIITHQKYKGTSDIKKEVKFSDSVTGAAPSQKIYGMIEKIVIKVGRLSSDDTMWEFTIQGKTFGVPAKKLNAQTTFQQGFLNTFHRPAPRVKKADMWLELIAALSEDEAKTTILEDPEESDVVNTARMVFDLICELPVSDDSEAAALGQVMYPDEGYYFVTSKKVTEICESIKCRYANSNISKAMVELGYKMEGNKTHRLGSVSLRCWKFVTGEVEKIKKGE